MSRSSGLTCWLLDTSNAVDVGMNLSTAANLVVILIETAGLTSELHDTWLTLLASSIVLVGSGYQSHYI